MNTNFILTSKKAYRKDQTLIVKSVAPTIIITSNIDIHKFIRFPP